MAAKCVHVLSGFGLWFLLSALLNHSLGTAGVAAFGVCGVAWGLINPLNMMLSQGSLQLTSRAVAAGSAADAAFGACLRATLRLGGLVSLSVFVGADLLARQVLGDPSYAGLLRLGAAVPLLYALRAVVQGWCNGTRRFAWQSGLDMGSSILRMACVLAGAAAGWGAKGFMGGMLAAALVMVALALFVVAPRGASRAQADPGAGAFSSGRLLSAQVLLMAGTLATSLLTNLDAYAVKAVAATDPALTDRLAGYYTGCQKIAQIPWSLVTGLVWVLFPLVAEERGGAARRLALRQGFRVLLLLLVPVSALLLSTAHETYGLVFAGNARQAREVFGDGLDLVSAPLLLLAPAYLLNGLLVAASLLLNAEGRAVASLAIMGGSVALARILTLTWTAEHGPRGAAAGLLVASAAGLIAALVVLSRRHGAVVPALTLLRVAAVGGLVWTLGRALPGEGLALLAKDAALLAAALAGLLLTRELRAAELRALWAALRRRSVPGPPADPRGYA